MPLSDSTLKSQLELHWLVPEGGSFPANVQQSAERFASAVATWFSDAQANGLPCTTAQARKSELASQAATAFAAGSAALAGQGLANALSAYILNQTFGAGVAGTPTGATAAVSAFTETFSNLKLANGDRAQKLAEACQKLALSTIVTFPPPTPPANVT